MSEKTTTKLRPELSAVADKYTKHGWKVVIPPSGINDLIAQRGQKLHFVQIMTKETRDLPRYSGEAKNDFIQNAFSNAAAPVHANVTTQMKKINGAKVATNIVTFENVNLNTRVIVGTSKNVAPQ